MTKAFNCLMNHMIIFSSVCIKHIHVHPGRYDNDTDDDDVGSVIMEIIGVRAGIHKFHDNLLSTEIGLFQPLVSRSSS